MPCKKIVIIGPESTGKSSLCTLLADHYKTLWAEEYAREYLLTNGTGYTYEDLFTIAQGQLRNEDNGIAAVNAMDGDKALPLFIDTDMNVMKVWSEFVFGKCDNRILTEIATRSYDLYLLCATDTPWVKDALREYPDLETREKLFHFYKDLLVFQNTPWVLISGDYEQRLKTAILAVDTLLL